MKYENCAKWVYSQPYEDQRDPRSRTFSPTIVIVAMATASKDQKAKVSLTDCWSDACADRWTAQ